MKNITFSKDDSRFENAKPKKKRNFKKKAASQAREFQEDDRILADLGDDLSFSDDLSKEVKELEDFMSDNFSVFSEIKKKEPSVHSRQCREKSPGHLLIGSCFGQDVYPSL